MAQGLGYPSFEPCHSTLLEKGARLFTDELSSPQLNLEMNLEATLVLESTGRECFSGAACKASLVFMALEYHPE